MIGTFTPTLSPITGWDYINPAGGLKDATDSATHRGSVICAMGTKIYVAWGGLPSGGLLQRIHVAEYDPSTTTWTQISPSGGVGLNKVAGDFAQAPDLCVFDGKLYCTWHESGTAKIRVRVWSGSGTTWTFVDGDSTTGINKATNRGANTPRLTVLNSKLYAVWHESASAGGNTDEQIRCRVYNGNDGAPAWTFVDGNLATGLNKVTTERAVLATPVVFNSKLYLFWIEQNASAIWQLRCRVYNGNDGAPAWTFVDGNGVNGLNFNTTQNAAELINVGRYIGVGVYNGKLYVSSIEGNKTTVRLRVYNGNDGAPSWTFVDGNAAQGLNEVAAASVGYTDIVCPPDWNMHVLWTEGTPKFGKVRVYNGEDSSIKHVDTASSELSFTPVYITSAFLNTLYVAHGGTPTAVYIAKARV